MKRALLFLTLLWLLSIALAGSVSCQDFTCGATCICYPYCEYMQMPVKWDPDTWVKKYAYWGQFVSCMEADAYINYVYERCWETTYE